MTTARQTWTERMVEAAGTTVQVVKGGVGRPLIVLHDEMGPPGWLNFHESLAQDFSIIAPTHPGYGESPYLDWIMNMRDMAGWYLEALDDMEVEKCDLMGFSFGGWLAAEMATMHPDRFNKLTFWLTQWESSRPPARYSICFSLWPKSSSQRESSTPIIHRSSRRYARRIRPRNRLNTGRSRGSSPAGSRGVLICTIARFLIC